MAQIKIPDIDAVKIKDIGIINATDTKTIAQQIEDAMYPFDSGESQKEYANGYVILFQTEGYVDNETKLIMRGPHQAFPYGDGGFIILDGGKFYELSGQRATLIEVDNYKKRGRELVYDHSIELASASAVNQNTPPSSLDLFNFSGLASGKKVYVLWGVGGSYGRYAKGNRYRRIIKNGSSSTIKTHRLTNAFTSYKKMDTKYRYHSYLCPDENNSSEPTSITIPESGWITWEQILKFIFVETFVNEMITTPSNFGYESGGPDFVYYDASNGIGKHKNKIVKGDTTFGWFNNSTPEVYRSWFNFNSSSLFQSIKEGRDVFNDNFVLEKTHLQNKITRQLTPTTPDKFCSTNIIHIYLKFSLDANFNNGVSNVNGWNGSLFYQGLDLAIRFTSDNNLGILVGIYNI